MHLKRKKKGSEFFSQLFLGEEKHAVHLGLQESSSKPWQMIVINWFAFAKQANINPWASQHFKQENDRLKQV